MPAINRPTNTQQRIAPPIRKAFDQWTLSDAKIAVEWIKDRRVGLQGFRSNWAYVQDHDHLQDGEGWIGPDGGKEMLVRSRVKSAVERQFTPVDAVGEVLDTIANALLQNKAQVAFEPLKKAKEGSKEEETQQEDAKAKMDLLSTWMDQRGFWIKGREVVKRSRAFTWGVLRAWIPESAIAPAVQQAEETTGIVGRVVGAVKRAVGVQEEPDKGEQQTTIALPTNLDLEDALSRIYLSAPQPDQGFVYVDPDSQRKIGIFLYTDDKQDYVELCWVREDGQTVMRTLTKGGDQDSVTHDLGERVLMNQMEADLLITGPVRMQQAQLNFANSLLTRVMETAGFPERHVIDAMPFGELTKDPPANVPAILAQVDPNGVEWYVVPKDPSIGAGVLTQIRSLTDPGQNGQETARTAQVVFRDPTDPDYLIRAIRAARGTILRQCKQGHIEMDDQATATGWSRVQARAAFVADVTAMVEPLVQLIRETLESVLAYAALMSPEAQDILDTYRIVVQVHINVGPVDPQEQTAILERLKAGALSLPTALTLLQVDDVDGEIERIRSQPESQRAQLKDQVEIGGNLISQWGLDVATVAELVGLPDEMVRSIKKAQDAIDLEAQQRADAIAAGNTVDAQGNPLPPGNGNQPPNQPQPQGNRNAAQAA